jgi:hypothetical protein
VKMADEYIDKVKVGAKIQMMYIRREMDYGGENDFCRGMRKALRVIKNMPAADVQPVNQWINVKDRLPATRKTVLIYDEYEGVSAGYYDSDYAKFRSIEDVYRSCYVTHWQPLPEPPKDDTD